VPSTNKVQISEHWSDLNLAEVTEEWLDYSAKQGNDLRSIGLTGGCKWCLCVSRWKEALDAAKGSEAEKGKLVPK